MSFATALLDLAGGYGRGKQQQFQNQQAEQQNQATQEELAMRQQEDAEQRAVDEQQRQLIAGQIQDQETARQHLKSNQAFEAKLKLPPGFDNMTPDQQTAYLRVRQNAAYAAGDYEFAQEVQKQIDGLAGLTKAGIAAQAAKDREAMLSQMWAARNAANITIGQGHDTTQQIDTAQRDATTLAGDQIRGDYQTKIAAIRSTGTKTATDVGSKYLGTEIGKMTAANSTALAKKLPQPYPQLNWYSAAANQAIAIVAQHPEQLQQQIEFIQAAPEKGDKSMTPDMKAAVIDAISQTAAQATAQQKQAEAMQQRINEINNSQRGSNANGNPPAWFR